MDAKCGQHSDVQGRPLLLSPLILRELTLKNRIVVSPMSMYAASDGQADDFHLVHLGRFALGGAGLVMLEATAVTERGRITHGCLGLWKDEQVAPLRRIVDALHRFDAASGIQLGHSGWKGGAQRPWHGGGPLDDVDSQKRNEKTWPVVSASGAPYDEGWIDPEPLDETSLAQIVESFRAAARRAEEAGFDVLELHCAHGYLLHSFLSPLSNRRADTYGGSLENRMRFPLEVAAALRQVWPAGKPLFVRISSVDGIDYGWSLADSIAFARKLGAIGVDVIDCSSGGMKLPRDRNLVAREPGFHIPFAETVRQECSLATVAVGLIRDPCFAEAILKQGKADLIALGREMLFNPNWAGQAEVSLGGESGWRTWPEPYGWWLSRRARLDHPR